MKKLIRLLLLTFCSLYVSSLIKNKEIWYYDPTMIVGCVIPITCIIVFVIYCTKEY